MLDKGEVCDVGPFMHAPTGDRFEILSYLTSIENLPNYGRFYML